MQQGKATQAIQGSPAPLIFIPIECLPIKKGLIPMNDQLIRAFCLLQGLQIEIIPDKSRKKVLTKPIVIKPLKVGAMQYRKPKGIPSSLSSSTGGRHKIKVVYLLPFCLLLFGGGFVGCSKSGPFGLGGLDLGGFGGNITKISDIQQNQNNANATVYLQGEVAIRAPFLKNGAYQLKDATGTIWVLANQAPPNVGDELLIKGQVQFQSIPVAGQELGEVYVQEEQLLKRKAGKSQSSIKEKK